MNRSLCTALLLSQTHSLQYLVISISITENTQKKQKEVKGEVILVAISIQSHYSNVCQTAFGFLLSGGVCALCYSVTTSLHLFHLL